jgi:hypothetical protein
VIDETSKPENSVCGAYPTEGLAKIAIYDAVIESLYENKTIEDFSIVMEKILFES